MKIKLPGSNPVRVSAWVAICFYIYRFMVGPLSAEFRFRRWLYPSILKKPVPAIVRPLSGRRKRRPR